MIIAELRLILHCLLGKFMNGGGRNLM